MNSTAENFDHELLEPSMRRWGKIARRIHVNAQKRTQRQQRDQVIRLGNAGVNVRKVKIK